MRRVDSALENEVEHLTESVVLSLDRFFVVVERNWLAVKIVEIREGTNRNVLEQENNGRLFLGLVSESRLGLHLDVEIGGVVGPNPIFLVDIDSVQIIWRVINSLTVRATVGVLNDVLVVGDSDVGAVLPGAVKGFDVQSTFTDGRLAVSSMSVVENQQVARVVNSNILLNIHEGWELHSV